MTIIENSRQTCAEIANQIEKEIRNYEVYLSQIETYKRQIKDKKQEISRLKNLLSSADKSEIPFIRQKIEEEENLIKWLPGSIQTAKQQAENPKLQTQNPKTPKPQNPKTPRKEIKIEIK